MMMKKFIFAIPLVLAMVLTPNERKPMRKILTSCVLAAAMLAVPATASAAQAPTPTTTTQAQLPPGTNYNCSVTAFGPTFETTLVAVQTYQAGTACSKEGASSVYKQVTADLQLRNGNTWFSVTKTAISSGGLSRTNPVRTPYSGWTYVTGHVYRVVAFSTLEVPAGYAGCSRKGPWACYKQVTTIAEGQAIKAPTAPTQ
jgi:hypothetical protein